MNLEHIRPSRFPLLANCPGSWRLFPSVIPETPDMLRGRALHAAVPPFSPLPEDTDDREAVMEVRRKLGDLEVVCNIEDNWYERELSCSVGEHTIRGTADYIGLGDVILLADFKFGHQRPQAAEQVMAYVAMYRRSNPNDSRTIKVAVISPYYETAITDFPFTSRERVDVQFETIALDAIYGEEDTGTVTFRPGDHCRMCPAVGHCPAHSITMEPEQSCDIGDKAKWLRYFKTVLAPKAKGYEEDIKKELSDGKPVHGFRLIDVKGRRLPVRASDVVEKYKAEGIDFFLSLCTFDYSAAEEHFCKHSEAKPRQAKELFRQWINPPVGEPTKSLKMEGEE